MLVCTGYICPSANGSNNVSRQTGEELKFWVDVRRDAALEPPYTVKWVKDNNFELHYKVEGACA